MCTSRGDKKIETRSAGPTHGSFTSVIPMTLPSAGASSPPATCGASRSGSRKKPVNAIAGTASTAAAPHHPTRARIPTPAIAGTMKGQPSGAIGMRTPSHAGRLDPRHHLAQPPPDLLDRMLGLALADGQELRAVGLVLEHPFPRELPPLDLAKDLPHLGLGLVVDDPRTARVVPVLRGVRDGVPHVREPTLVEQVHDQLHLVHALEVGHLGLIARLDER